MTIAIKYCGGCNPRYDRGTLAKQLHIDFPEANILPSGNLHGAMADVVAVFVGCGSACASHAELHGRYGKIVLSGPEDYPALAQLVRDHLGEASVSID